MTRTWCAELRAWKTAELCSSMPSAEDLAEQAALGEATVSRRGPSCRGQQSHFLSPGPSGLS